MSTPQEVLAQLDTERRTVAFDAYDIIVRQLLDMLLSDAIDIAPEYQRQFVWNEPRESELIESILLGIPVPSLYMAVNAADGSWEVVDGVQRLSTVAHFWGERRLLEKIGRKEPLKLQGLEKLSTLNDWTFERLPKPVQTGFLNRSLRVTTLNDRSDVNVRFDLFERLNTGGVGLHAQEIRNIVYRGDFKNSIRELSMDKNFRAVLRLPRGTRDAGTSAEYEEAVLRFFAFLNNYGQFDHSVKEFLNSYMKDNAAGPPTKADLTLFKDTFSFLKRSLPSGITRGRDSTPINLYEAIAVGTALALRGQATPKRRVVKALLTSPDLRKFTTQGTNSRVMVARRIELVRDALA